MARRTAHPQASSPLETFHPVVRQWFAETFGQPTSAQVAAWPAIAQGRNTLLLAPTGSGKTLAAFLVAIDRLMFRPPTPDEPPGVRVLYISPLKALAVDVEKNLRVPLAGVEAVAQREGVQYQKPRIAVRSGDTPSSERYRHGKHPPDIFITTPESLFLMLTSQARETLRTVETIIVDEIHSLVGTKRGAHLFVTLERLERLRRELHDEANGQVPVLPAQRIGLSATQRPLNEVARLLGGFDVPPPATNNGKPLSGRAKKGKAEATAPTPQPRPVEIVEVGRRRPLELTIEVPVDDMAQLAQSQQQDTGPNGAPAIGSIWPAMHPRLVELIRAHRSTMIFVNARRLAERLATAINDLAGEELALAHHGSIARDTRLLIEERLKSGQLPAIVATSSLELGIDMGAVDLVIQIEAPPSIAAGVQRVGRSGHRVGETSRGVIFPKFRGDLLACTAAVARMQQGEVEATYYPRNPLDVLAQQIVAMAALEPVPVADVYATVRAAAPFAELPETAFEGVLDLLSGRYPADEFAELKPRITWDRLTGMLSPRRGTQRMAVANAGTIPDRGLYGVFVADGPAGGSRVGELDEEMVFELKPGEVFLLGASSWRVTEITHDRVLVVPAPGETGKMPFWRGDGPGRPLEFGQAIGALARQLIESPREDALTTLTNEYGLDARAAANLLKYLADQQAATGDVPCDRTIVVESFLDEVGDWRVVVMTPFGSRVHAPWTMAVARRLRAAIGGEVDMMWSDDGMVFRLPESEQPPAVELLFPSADEIEDIVVAELGGTALFAARFRENAARALLLPKRQPGRRTPLWIQRRRSADLLAVASRYERFPILLETYRECLRDVFDLPGLKQVLAAVQRRKIRVKAVSTSSPSPFASSLLFSYTGNFLYNGDAPLAERKAQTLALDHAQLRELLGDAELRELLEPAVIESTAAELARLDGKRPVRHADALHELLLSIGDLTRDEVAARTAGEQVTSGELDRWLAELLDARRIIAVTIAGQQRYAAAEDAARLRDALGVELPPGLPEAFLEGVADPLGDLVSRYARCHVPFKADDVARRLGLGVAPVQAALLRLAARDRVVEGEFLPGGRGREWCDTTVLRLLKRRSLASLRRQIAPVEPRTFARFLAHWQGLHQPRRGLDGLLDMVEQLQGLPLPFSALEQAILPARVPGYQPGDLDHLAAAGEIVWRGLEPLGPHDGRIALYLTDHVANLAPVSEAIPTDDPLAQQIYDLLAQRGALFFDDLATALGGFRNDVLAALWRLVWQGLVTNDTLAPLRSISRQAHEERRRARRSRRSFRSRRVERLPGSEGRWSLVVRSGTKLPSATERLTALATQLTERYGVLTRELVASENVPGGFSALYPVLKAMEEAGRLRRGYFVAGQGAAQFAVAGAEDRLRELDREAEDAAGEVLILAATDPANPYGSALRWPGSGANPTDEPPAADGEVAADDEAAGSRSLRPQRAAGARVILIDGELRGYLGRTGKHLLTFMSTDEPEQQNGLAAALAAALKSAASPERPLVITRIDGQPVDESPLAPLLVDAGFRPSRHGYLHRGELVEPPL